MLLTREEMSYAFGGARFDPVADREMLAWMFNQFLYGEVTGIQCGHWLYNAPNLHAARFIAQQASEEFQHVDNFLRCLAFIDASPAPPHKLVQYLSTGMMPATWEEHVSLEMAQGEGFVLMAFYAIIDTLDHEEIVGILRRAVKQEERHVAFGEEQTMLAVAERPGLKRRLLGLNLVSLWAIRRLARHIGTKMPADHPVLRQLGPFVERVSGTGELRLMRMGLLDRPLHEISATTKIAWVAEAYGFKVLGAVGRFLKALIPFWGQPKRLTDSYLGDPSIVGRHAQAQQRGQSDQGQSSLASPGVPRSSPAP